MDVRAAFDLSGRTAVVTGAGSGIGRATAQVLASAGAAVACGDVDEAGAEETRRTIADDGGTAIATRADVALKHDVERLVRRAVDEWGRLDVMCNVAGVAADGFILDATEEQLDRAIAINLKGVFWGCQAAVSAMRERGAGGSIINVSSTAIDQPAPRFGMYAMTKAAITMLTKTLAIEAGRFGIRVNAVAPGATITQMTARHLYGADGTLDQAQYDQFVEQMRKLSPLRVVGDPMDQAYLMLYLASDAARFCTGQIWRANGGQSMPW